MYKLHCDLCERDVSKEENVTKVTWEDNNGYEFTSIGYIFRKPRKMICHICDTCLALLKEKGTKE